MGGSKQTVEDGPVDGQKAVLEGLLEVAALEGVLFCNDIVQVLSGVQSDLVSSVSVIYTKVTYAQVQTGGLGLLVALEWLQVKYTGVGVLHADSPSLHARDAEGDAVILSTVGFLRKALSAGTKRRVHGKGRHGQSEN